MHASASLSAVVLSLAASGVFAAPFKRTPQTTIEVPGQPPHVLPCHGNICPEKREPQSTIEFPGKPPFTLPCDGDICPEKREPQSTIEFPGKPPFTLPCDGHICPEKREPQTTVEFPGQPPHRLPCDGDLCPLVARQVEDVHVHAIEPTPVILPKREPILLPPGATPIPCTGPLCGKILEDREPQVLLPGETPHPVHCIGEFCPVEHREVSDEAAPPTPIPGPLFRPGFVGPKREPQALLPGQTPHPLPCIGDVCPIELREVHDIAVREPGAFPASLAGINDKREVVTREPQVLEPGEVSPVPPCRAGALCPIVVDDKREVQEREVNELVARVILEIAKRSLEQLD